MTINLFTIRPSEPDRLVEALREGRRVEELRTGIHEFLTQSAPSEPASLDLVYATAAQLASAGIFEAVDVDQIGSAFIGVPSSTFDRFLEGLSERTRTDIRRFARQSKANDFQRLAIPKKFDALGEADAKQPLKKRIKPQANVARYQFASEEMHSHRLLRDPQTGRFASTDVPNVGARHAGRYLEHAPLSKLRAKSKPLKADFRPKR